MKYIDLGLPSGTLWSDTNEEGFYTFGEAVVKYGYSLPTKEQWEELKNLCQWEWMGNGYKVTGHNDNSIVLPASGFRNYDGAVYCVGSYGDYWSSTPYGLDHAWNIGFGSGNAVMNCGNRYNETSVRLIK